MAANPNVPQDVWDYKFNQYVRKEFPPDMLAAMIDNAVADSDGE